MSIMVGPQSFHDGEEAQPSRRPPGQGEMTDDLEDDSLADFSETRSRRKFPYWMD